jgi:GAF domain-containing protein
VDDVSTEPAFAKDVAESTGYVPRSIVAFPLVTGDAPLGVMELLDCEFQARRGIDCLDFVAPFAAQAAIVLNLLQRDRAVGEAVAADGGLREISALTSMLTALGGERRGVAVKLVELLEELM